MIIKIANLSDGEHVLSFDEEVKLIGIEDPFFDSCKVFVKLQKSHSQIVLDTELKLKAQYECDRCGSEFETDVITDFKMVYLFGDEPEQNDDSNLKYLPVDADRVDIREEIRDYALLAIPMKKLCKEDCKGLCPKCGKNLNEGNCQCKQDETDSRWKPLMELKNKLN